MATALDLISRALRTVGELPAGETAQGDYAEDCLDVLNALIEQLNLEDLILYYEKTEEFNLVSGQVSYTIGTGGDLSTLRPIEILAAQLRDANDLDIDLGMVSNDTYQRLTQKVTTPTLPSIISYNPNYPLGEIKVWPTPGSGLRLRLSSNKLLAAFAELSDAVDLPPGMTEVLVYGLADRLVLESGRADMADLITQKFEDAKANVKRKNGKMDLMNFDPRLMARRLGTYNPFTDE